MNGEGEREEGVAEAERESKEDVGCKMRMSKGRWRREGWMDAKAGSSISYVKMFRCGSFQISRN